MPPIPSYDELTKQIREDADYLIAGLRNGSVDVTTAIPLVLESYIRRASQSRAEEHFKKHGIEYVRKATLETINRLFKLEEE